MPVEFSQSLRLFAKLGLLSFGGPAGQIALMHKWLVDEKAWLSEREFLTALNFCMLLPGPEAMQLATYCGWKLHGAKGGLMAGLLFILPGACLMIGLAALYMAYGQIPLLVNAFMGVKAAVLAILAEALWRMSKRSLHNKINLALAATAFVAIAILNLPFWLILIAAATLGALISRQAETTPAPSLSLSAGKLMATSSLWLALWLAPLGMMIFALGFDHVLSQLALFFSKLAVISFGGAYAILSVVADEAIRQNWLSPAQMIDGLGLAETTPGPLILVLLFVGFGAAGLSGALVTLWATFAPCFLWIMALSPYIQAIESRPRLKSALSGITAAVIGIIFHLGLWFGFHTIIGWKQALLAILAFALLFLARLPIVWLLFSLAISAIALSWMPV